MLHRAPFKPALLNWILCQIWYIHTYIKKERKKKERKERKKERRKKERKKEERKKERNERKKERKKEGKEGRKEERKKERKKEKKERKKERKEEERKEISWFERTGGRLGWLLHVSNIHSYPRPDPIVPLLLVGGATMICIGGRSLNLIGVRELFSFSFFLFLFFAQKVLFGILVQTLQLTTLKPLHLTVYM